MGLVEGQLLIFFIIYISESSGVIDAPLNAAKKVWEIYSTLNESNLICSPELTTFGQLFGNDAKVYARITDPMYEIRASLHEIENSINSKMKDILMKIVRSTVMAYRSVDTMELFISSIAADYKTFDQIILQYGYSSGYSLGNLTTSIFPDIEANIAIIRKIMTDPREMLPGKSSLIAAISDYAKAHYDEICNTHQSIDEILVYVYKIAIMAEIETSVMLPFANLNQCTNHEDRRMMNDAALVKFQRYFREYASIMQQHLNLAASLYMRACDPTSGAWILNKNYYELYETTQTIILQYQPTEGAPEYCQNMWQLGTTECDVRYYDERSGCSSTPTDCKNLGAVQACVLKNGPKKLQYLNSTISGFSGNSSKCPEDDAYIIDTGEVSNSAYATCGCQCHENHNKISLMVMGSEVYSNEVVIGLRFKRSNDTLHIQPRVGKLIALGNIERYSERWVKIPNEIDSSLIHYAKENDSILFLDDVLLPPKFVLTGIRFVEVKRGTVTGLAIEASGVSFDYRSGELNHNRKIQSSSARDNPGQPLLFFAKRPPQTKKLNTVISTDMKYVQLKQPYLRSDFKQSVLPLFDAIPVTTDPPIALGGLGIFHKSVEFYAGFIALRIYGISYAPYFQNSTSSYEFAG